MKITNPALVRTVSLLAVMVILCSDRAMAQATQSAPATGDSAAQDTPEQDGTRPKPRDKRKRKTTEDPLTSIGPRPYRAVFGGATRRTDLKRTLDINANVSEAYDQNRLAEASSPDASPLANSDGFYSSLVGDMTFTRRGTRLEVAASGGASARYYRDLQQFFGTDYHGGFGVSARLSPLTQLRVNQSLSFAPVDLMGVFLSAAPPVLGAAPAATTDFATNSNRSRSESTGVDVSRRLTARADIAFSGSTRLTHFLANPSANNSFRELGGGGVYHYRMSEGVSLRLGYGYRGAEYGVSSVGSSPGEHSLDIGLDLRKMLSESRRTSFALKSGSAIVSAATPTNTQSASRQLRVLVDASLSHQMGETWEVTGSYRRGSDIVQGLTSLVFTDAVSLTTGGFVSRHVDFRSSIAYSTGEPSLAASSQNFTSYTGTARMRIAFNEKMAATTEYLYYFYDFSRAPQLVPGYVPRLSRNSVKVGLSLWLPVGRR
ncbi:MAG: hypothetical protein U0Q11_07930 [Vicinamibacterales bacterium]